MTHEIHDEIGRRSRALPDRDGSRYQTVKLVVQRQGARTAAVSFVVVDVGKGRLQDTRLGFAVISTVDNVGRQLPPLMLMLRAQETLLKQMEQELRT
jgi:hypothetical protein